MSSRISRSESLSTIPQRKLMEALENTIRICPECSTKNNVKLDHGLCKTCRVKNIAIQRYAESNIPVRYWTLEMDASFKGDPILMEKYHEITDDLKKSYRDGTSICFAGSNGLGKTLVLSNILKRAAEHGLSCLYVNLGDIVSVLTNYQNDDRAIARKELMIVDFLAIDEFDPRYMSNDKASDLFGKVLEEIFRTRHQNGLPTFMSTNSPNVVDSFQGALRQSINSLMSTVQMVAVLGKDFRIVSKKSILTSK